jgi:hypothetical protein
VDRNRKVQSKPLLKMFFRVLAMKAYRGAKVKLHSFLTSAEDIG